ncbi:MAG: PKD domain-containing protein [Flavobacteriales bacterium]|nr:PKD domain-containing protein [Flavobacteriales bacterium]
MNRKHSIKLGLTMVVFMVCTVLRAQVHSIAAGEYFIDSDPGEGLGIPLTPSDGAFNNIWEQVNATLAALPVGRHTLNIRLQDGNGNWGNVFSRSIVVDNLLNARDIKITQGEFFVDTDPGEGSGIALISFDGNYSDAWESLGLNNISMPLGVHTLNIRIKGLDGNWGPIFKRVITVENSLSSRNIRLTSAEIFFDADPGVGNGIAVVAFDGVFSDAFETVIQTSLTTNPGLHKIGIRLRGIDNTWGPVFARVITVENPIVSNDTKIEVAEYFFDNDPGEGNGSTLIAFDGNFSDAFEKVFAEGVNIPASGLHRIYVRVANNSGDWSATFSTSISIEDILSVRNISITASEYFFNTDPGEGNAITLLAFDGNYNGAFEAAFANSLSVPIAGAHTLSVRSRGLDGSWSELFSTVFAVEEAITARDLKITQGEFFWNTDPGEGAGTALIAFDGNFNNAFESAFANGVSSPGNGLHKLYVRMRGLDGEWSETFSIAMTIETPITSRDVKIVYAEYFFDSDPGEGNGSALLAIDGNYNNAYEKISSNTNSGLLEPGAHVLNIRNLGLDGTWSNSFRTAIYIDACLTSPLVTTTPSGNISICPEDSILLTATVGLESYQWYSGLNLVGNQQTLWVDSAAFYRVIGFDDDGCPGVSANVQITEYSVPENTITPNGPISFCTGGSVALNASNGFASYLWSNSAVTQSIQVTQSGSYSCVAATAGGCERTSNTVVVNVYAAPITPIITPINPVICFNDSVVLSSSYSSGIVWNTGETSQEITVGAGIYTLVYTDGSNCSSQSSATVVVDDAISSIAANGYNFYLPSSTVDFTASIIGDVTNYLWDFGDGNTSSAANPTHTYVVDGLYITSLTVTSSSGCNTVEYLSPIQVWQVFPSDDVSLPIVVDATGSTWLSPLIGYVTLPNGQLCFTTNGGLTWTPIVTGTNDDIYGVTYTGDANNYAVWIFGANGLVCVSYNGGPFLPANPSGLLPGTNFYGGFWSGGSGYYFGNNNTICYYYNGTWYPINPTGVPTGTTWYGGWYAGGYLWAFGSGGLICYYNFGTGQWYSANGTGGGGGTGGGTTFYGGYYSGASTCVFVGGSGGTVWGSYDNGNTWGPINTGYQYTWYDVFVNGSTIICVGEGGAICVSTDGGLTWELYSTGDTNDCTGIEANGCLAYITTANGGVFQFPIPQGPSVAPEISANPGVICSGENAILSVSNPKIGSTYLWNNGATGSSASVNNAGIYFVTEHSFCDTISSLSVEILSETGVPFFADNDGDGFGNPTNTTLSCNGTPSGFVSDNTDCNDNRDDVYPGAPGTGEGVDNDCSGIIDTDENYCPADLNNDEIVGISDLLIFLSIYGTSCSGPPCTGDFNDDLQVGVSDLLIFLSLFGSPCP